MMTVAKFQLILLDILAENWRSDQNALSARVNYLQLKMTFSTCNYLKSLSREGLAVPSPKLELATVLLHWTMY